MGTSYNFDKVWSGAPDGRFGKLCLIRDANNFYINPNRFDYYWCIHFSMYKYIVKRLKQLISWQNLPFDFLSLIDKINICKVSYLLYDVWVILCLCFLNHSLVVIRSPLCSRRYPVHFMNPVGALRPYWYLWGWSRESGQPSSSRPSCHRLLYIT